MRNHPKKIQHLSDDDLAALKEGKLHEKRMLKLLDHMSNCSLCAEKYAACFAADELLDVPSGFAENIMSGLKPEKKEKKQMIFYSMRVAVAVCATLILIFSNMINLISDFGQKIQGYELKGQSIVEVMNSSFQTFSKRILELEVFVNENEKK